MTAQLFEAVAGDGRGRLLATDASVRHSRQFRVAAAGPTAVDACLREIDGRTVATFTLAGGARAGALGPAEGRVIEALIAHAVGVGVPIVGTLATSGADISEGVSALHAWGRVARALVNASGVVPIVLAVTGPCLSGPALLLGLADHVVMTPDAFAYVSGPAAVREMTGVDVSSAALGGAHAHSTRTGLASLVVATEHVDAAIGDLLAYLPANHLDDPPCSPFFDDSERLCDAAARAVPIDTRAGYDMRDVVADVLDSGTFLEVGAGHALNMITGYGRLAGRVVGVVGNQPMVRAGTIDIHAASKAARFVQTCDAFNVSLVTFVDTPGFEPGRDLEWRGMIRHGAELVYAYSAASVPRVCVIVRKAFGGAYIVMDSRQLGSDACFAWSGSEIAVMGAAGAVAVLHGRELAAIADSDARAVRQAALADEYARVAADPAVAAERGLLDDVIDPRETRAVLVGALHALRDKRELRVARKHGNSPL